MIWKAAAFAMSLLMVGCASSDEGASHWIQRTGGIEKARSEFEAGDLTASLHRSRRLIEARPHEELLEPFQLYVKSLDGLGRSAEAQALAAYRSPRIYKDETQQAAADAQQEASADKFKADCRRLWRELPQSRNLIQGWGPRSKRPDVDPWFGEEGEPVQAVFEIGADAKPIDIQIARAPDAVRAVRIVQTIGEIEVFEGRLRRLDPQTLPVRYCIAQSWDNSGGEQPSAPDINIRGSGIHGP